MEASCQGPRGGRGRRRKREGRDTEMDEEGEGREEEGSWRRTMPGMNEAL